MSDVRWSELEEERRSLRMAEPRADLIRARAGGSPEAECLGRRVRAAEARIQQIVAEQRIILAETRAS